jgi:hypothetical protein
MLYPTLKTSVFFGTPVQKRFRISNVNRHSGPPNTSRWSTPPSRTSWPVFLTLYSQQFRASRITKQSTPPESFYKQTRGQSALTWAAAHWDTWASSSWMLHMPWLLQQRTHAQHFGQLHRPPGGPQPTRMEQRPKSARLATDLWQNQRILIVWISWKWILWAWRRSSLEISGGVLVWAFCASNIQLTSLLVVSRYLVHKMYTTWIYELDLILYSIYKSTLDLSIRIWGGCSFYIRINALKRWIQYYDYLRFLLKNRSSLVVK